MMEPNKKRITLTGLKEALPLYSFIRPYRLQYGFGLFFLLGSSLANLAFPKLLGELVNAGNAGNLAENINRIALFLAALLVIQSTFSYFRTVLFVTVTEKTLADLRQYTYNHLIKLPLRFFEQRRVGELNSRISSDISLLQETLTSTLAEFIRQIIIIVGGIALLMYTSFKLTLFMLAILPAVVLLAVVFGRFIRRFSKKAQAEVAASNTIVEETLQGIQSVKSYTNEFLEIARYKHKTEEIALVGMKSGRYRGAFAAFLIFGLFGALITVIWRGSILLAEGEMASGDLFAFVLYSGFIGGTIGGMASVFTRIQKFLGATEDLFAIFEEEEEQLHDVSTHPAIHTLKGAIRFDKVSFAYPNRPEVDVLNAIELAILPHQMVALVGASGAGKSTITALLLRLHDAQKGTILFDEIPNNQIPLSELRSQIALVPQDIFLFGGSIRDNISYGNPHATADAIEEAARNANAMEFIERFAEGMETIVGERGTQLSGGQRQRIAIARALLKNPKILILDEATSALDSKSEQLVQDALKRLMHNRTTIVIAHRLSTIKNADVIFVLENGRLIESGTHEQLMLKPKGIYQKLSQLQKMEDTLT